MSEQQTIPIHIDLEKDIFSYAMTGIRRAYAFAGLVFHPSNKMEINTYMLPADDNINTYFTISNSLPDIKKHFDHWILRNGLREIIESFEISAIRLYHALYMSKNKITLIEGEKIIKKYKRENFPRKMELLNEILNGHISDEINYLKGIQNLRNCLTHNRGVVDKEEIILEFPEIQMFAKNLKGEERPIVFGEPFGEEVDICMRFITNPKTFKFGEIIALESRYFSKLCFGTSRILDRLKHSLIQTLQENGVEVKINDSN